MAGIIPIIMSVESVTAFPCWRLSGNAGVWKASLGAEVSTAVETITRTARNFGPSSVAFPVAAFFADIIVSMSLGHLTAVTVAF